MLKVDSVTPDRICYKPFLKWAGGKNWFTRYLDAFLGDLKFNRYYEPFLGGGSVFFHLNPNNAQLSDANKELIDAYLGVQSDVEGVLTYLSNWEVCEEAYYKIRKIRSNDRIVNAARFIYLNRTSFNGIYRVNRKGEYNVPYGNRDGYEFDVDRIRTAAIALKDKTIIHSDFNCALQSVSAKDLVFLDPPYTVSHNNNGFIEYNKKLFSLEDQHRLKSCIDSIIEKDAYFILTNAAHETIFNIFKDCGKTIELSRFCGLGGRKAKRQSTTEYVFTNIPNILLEEL